MMFLLVNLGANPTPRTKIKARFDCILAKKGPTLGCCERRKRNKRLLKFKREFLIARLGLEPVWV